jgi:hypothetical protein
LSCYNKDTDQINNKDETMKKAIIYVLVCLLISNLAYCENNFFDRLASEAFLLTHQKVIYDPSYYSIDYPNGDVPANRGVCTDVVIRAYRKMGIDLQKEVHEDMKANFGIYPENWGLKRPDKNIDHRRVPNLMTFFSRHGKVKKISQNPKDYKPGDIVCWNLGGGLTHIGIVANKSSINGKRPMIIHNIGAGQVIEDCLFEFDVIGHYTFKK